MPIRVMALSCRGRGPSGKEDISVYQLLNYTDTSHP